MATGGNALYATLRFGRLSVRQKLTKLSVRQNTKLIKINLKEVAQTGNLREF